MIVCGLGVCVGVGVGVGVAGGGGGGLVGNAFPAFTPLFLPTLCQAYFFPGAPVSSVATVGK